LGIFPQKMKRRPGPKRRLARRGRDPYSPDGGLGFPRSRGRRGPVARGRRLRENLRPPSEKAQPWVSGERPSPIPLRQQRGPSFASTVAPHQMRRPRRRVAIMREIVAPAPFPSPPGPPAAWRSRIWRVPQSAAVIRRIDHLHAHPRYWNRSPGSFARKSIHSVFAFQSGEHLVLASAGAQSGLLRPPRFDFAQFSAVEIILDAQHRRRVDGFRPRRCLR